MPKHDPLDILLAHDHWATKNILDVCANLTQEQFHKPFEMGPGSLQNTLVHIMASMKTWTQTLAQAELSPRLDKDPPRSVPELLALHDKCCGEFAREARRLPLSQTVTRARDGKTYTFTRGNVVMQVTTHGMHHRAQCLNMLRHLGVKPLPPSSVTEWARMVDSAG